jgi:hypothetical protein
MAGATAPAVLLRARPRRGCGSYRAQEGQSRSPSGDLVHFGGSPSAAARPPVEPKRGNSNATSDPGVALSLFSALRRRL